jgi:alanine racemase
MRFRYEPVISIFIHSDHILYNLRQFQAAVPGVAVAPVLKSNAYGHGLVPVAKILDARTTRGALPFLCVDSYAEALVLRNEGVRTPLLAIGYTPLANTERNRLANVAFGVMSMEELRRLAAAAGRMHPTTIHLKIDTGMHRHGIMPDELAEAFRIIAGNKKIFLEGAYSHLADADAPSSAQTKKQIEAWNSAVRMIKEKMPSVKYFHLSATAGSHYAKEINANVMRLGIGLYGVNVGTSLDLLPALEMKTRITSVRHIAAGEPVGYNAAFTAPHAMTVATIPVGYAEGIDRRLMNGGSASVKGVACPFVGRINMNITSLDVSKVPAIKIDDEVQVISPEPGSANSIENMAKLCGTIPYEILVHVPAQIRKIVT